MDSFEVNKIFAAVLVAGITAMLGGFIAHKLVHPHELHEDAVTIEGGPVSLAAASGPVGPEPIMHLLAAADIERGAKLSKACAACHAFDKGGVNKVGPKLWNVVNRPLGSVAGFKYSDALIAHGGKWTFEELNGFMWKPKKHIEGTKMNYIGLKKPSDRAAIIAWLATLSDNPVVMPVVAPPVEEPTEAIPPSEIETPTTAH